MLFQLWIPIILATAVVAVYRLWRRMTMRLNFPVVGSPTDPDLAYAVLEGFQKYPDTPFIVPADPPRVMLPMSLHHEVCHAPENDLSFPAELYDIFLGKFTQIGHHNEDVINATRLDLTRNLGGVLKPIQDEMRHSMAQLVGDSTEWQTKTLYDMILRVVGLVSGRVFVGLPLSRDEDWLASSINFTVDISKCRIAMLKWNPWIRPFVTPFLPEVRHMRSEQKKAHEWMRPLVRDFAHTPYDMEEKGAKVGERGAFISWMMKYLPNQLRTPEKIGAGQMVLAFAAIHTSSATTTMVLYDLLSRPEYIQPLRQEIEQVIAEDGLQRDEDGEGYLVKSSFAKLKNLDSFIKESMRLNPLNYGGTARRVVKDYTFENGLKLPAGTAISFPMWGMYHSTATEAFNPEYNAETKNAPAAEFDGFRFSRLRDVPGRESKHQAATTGAEALNFGHGPRACPGRFFAVYLVKTILVELLLKYDLKLKGNGSGGASRRPPNIVQDLVVMPNDTAEIDIRRRP